MVGSSWTGPPVPIRAVKLPYGPSVRHLTPPGLCPEDHRARRRERSRRQAIDPCAWKADDPLAFVHTLRASAQRRGRLSLADSDSRQVFPIDPDGARVEIGFLRPCTRRWSARSGGREIR